MFLNKLLLEKKMDTGIFDYTIILSVIHKRILTEKDPLFKFLYFMTDTKIKITNKNYEQILGICQPNLTEQFKDLNSDDVKLAFKALDFLHERDNIQKNHFQITDDWLRRNRHVFKCKNMIEVKSLRNNSIEKKLYSIKNEPSPNHKKFKTLVNEL